MSAAAEGNHGGRPKAIYDDGTGRAGDHHPRRPTRADSAGLGSGSADEVVATLTERTWNGTNDVAALPAQARSEGEGT